MCAFRRNYLQIGEKIFARSGRRAGRVQSHPSGAWMGHPAGTCAELWAWEKRVRCFPRSQMRDSGAPKLGGTLRCGYRRLILNSDGSGSLLGPGHPPRLGGLLERRETEKCKRATPGRSRTCRLQTRQKCPLSFVQQLLCGGGGVNVPWCIVCLTVESCLSDRKRNSWYLRNRATSLEMD